MGDEKEVKTSGVGTPLVLFQAMQNSKAAIDAHLQAIKEYVDTKPER